MRRLTRMLSIAFLGASLVGCGQMVDEENVVNISILNSKPELQMVLDKAIDEFEATYPDIRVKVVKYNQSHAYQEKLVSMQQYGSTPTMILMDPTHINFIKEDIISLNDEAWTEHVAMDLSDVAKNDQGELIAFPFAFEGIGFIYNEDVLNEAGVDPNQINSLAKLEEAFKKIEAIGKGALIVANEDWSLANHFLPIAYSVQGTEGNQNADFIEGLKKGAVDLKTNTYINGLLDTFDVMKKYNIYNDAPLLHINSKCAELLGKGEVGFYYMGNWASGDILANTTNDTNYGFVPVPISNNSNDYGNHQITAVIKYLVVDGSHNSPEQQEAAKKFINWLVFEEAGQKFMVDEAKVIPGVDNNEREVTDPLMQSINKYQKEGNIIELNNADLPEKNAEIIGLYLRDYLNDKIDRDTLLEQIQEHWKKSFI